MRHHDRPPVAEVDGAGAERPRLGQLQVELRRQRREVGRAAAQHDRLDELPVLVDEVALDQRGGEARAAQSISPPGPAVKPSSDTLIE
jgi:hypothetical protein